MSQNRCEERVRRKAAFAKETPRAAAGLLLALLLIPVSARAEGEPAPLEASPEQFEAPPAPVADPNLAEPEAPGEASPWTGGRAESQCAWRR